MPKKIYIGRLPQDFPPQKLHDLFAPMGRVVSARVVAEGQAQGNSSHGYVEMESEAATKKAISALHNSRVEEARVIVMEAHFLDQERKPTQFVRKKYRR